MQDKMLTPRLRSSVLLQNQNSSSSNIGSMKTVVGVGYHFITLNSTRGLRILSETGTEGRKKGPSHSPLKKFTNTHFSRKKATHYPRIVIGQGQDKSKENMKPHQDHPEVEFHTGVLLEEQRNQILAEGNSEILMHESSAERSEDAIRELGRLIRSQHIGICHRDREYEASRLHAELQNREKAHQDARVKAIQEVEELKEICSSRPEELREDDFPEANCGKASPQ